MTNLTIAFKDLRKKGYFARMNFLCCQSCAWKAVPQDAEKVVFYHDQDADNLKEGMDLYLAWSGDANEIINILSRRGLICEWNGDAGKRIMVKNNSVKKV